MYGLMIVMLMGGGFMPQLSGPLPIFHGPDLSQPNVEYNSESKCCMQLFK